MEARKVEKNKKQNLSIPFFIMESGEKREEIVSFSSSLTSCSILHKKLANPFHNYRGHSEENFPLLGHK